MNTKPTDPNPSPDSDSSSPTIIVDQFVAAGGGKNIKGDEYKGLRIHTRPGLHSCVAEWVTRLFKPSGDILDLAAGSGALSLRMSDLGFRVHAIDYVKDNFRLHSQITFEAADLNGPFLHSVTSSFDGILAIEIIEHLENPRHFFRQCMRLLKPGGVLILTTPNIDSPASQALFVRTGRFMWFSDQNYCHEGHISPLSQWQLRACGREVGMEIIEIGSHADSLVSLQTWPKLRLFASLISRISRDDSRPQGEIFIGAWRKPS